MCKLTYNIINAFVKFISCFRFEQRWSPRGRPWPRGHILKSLALASKVKSLALASRPQVLENWPVLGSRTTIFFELLKYCGALEKFFGKRFFVGIARKIFVKTFFFFGEHLRLCPWFLTLASSIPVLGLESASPRKGCPWPWPRIFFVALALASSLVSSTPPLVLREVRVTKTPHGTRPIFSLRKQVVSTNDSRFLTLPSYSYKMHIGRHTRQLILMQVLSVIVKRFCVKSVVLKKRELFVVIKRCTKPFFTILNSSYSRKYVLICLISTIGNPAFRNFVTSQEVCCRSVLGA